MELCARGTGLVESHFSQFDFDRGISEYILKTDMLSRSKNQNVAIIGINRESAEILTRLLDAGGIRVLRMLNEREDFSSLAKVPDLDIIINVSDDADVVARLKRLSLRNVEIIGGLSARILFLSGNKETRSDGARFDRAKILNSLHEIKQAVLLSKNKEELLKLFLHVAMGSCRADSGSIMLLDSQKRFLKIEMADGLNGEIIRSTVQKLGKGVAGKVARTGKPLLINGTMDRAEAGGETERADLVSAICCPLVIRNEVVGVLNINSKRKDLVYSENDLAYIKELTEFSADVIKTSKDFDRSSTESFSLSLISAVQGILNLDYPIDERLNLILLKLANTFGAVICNYYQYNDESRIFLARASNSFNRDLLQGKRIRLNDTIARKVLDEGGTVCLNATDEKTGGKKWYLAQPVKMGNRLSGLLFLHLVSPADDLKNDLKEECRLLEKVGDLFSIELGKATERRMLTIQSTKFSAVSEASFQIASAATLKDMVNFVLPNACLILEAEAAVFWLLNPVSDRLELFSSFTIDNPDRIRDIEELDAAILDKTVPGDDALLVVDLQQEGYIEQGQTGNPKSLLCKTFGRGGMVAASFSLYGKKSLDLYGTRNFAPNDKEVFLKLCLQFSKGLSKLMPYFDERR